MRQLSMMAAVIGFFALAFVGWFNGVPVFVCALRALCGAVAVYLVMGLAGTVIVRIIADAAVDAQFSRKRGRRGES